MFGEDVGNHVMPLGGQSKSRPEFRVALLPDSADSEQIIRYALPKDGHLLRSVTEAVSDFMEHAAYVLAFHGIIHYEIATGAWLLRYQMSERRVEDVLAPERLFRPLRIPGKVLRIGSLYLQIVPKADRVKHGRAFVSIPQNQVWILRIPHMLGGPGGHQRLLKSFAKSSEPLPKFVRDEMEKLGDFGEFSFQEFHRQRMLTLASETANWGWDARELWRNDTLEYFRVYRQLRFARSMAILRDYLISSINSLLGRIAFPARITVHGLPTREDIDGVISALAKKEVSINEALVAVDIW